MSSKITEISYVGLAEGNTIKVKTDGKRLIETVHCDYLIIWYNCDARESSQSMKIYAVEKVEDGTNMLNSVETWYDGVAITKALSYISENLI
jgi:hypothetical protein